jgi:hypothetical protein
MTEVDDRGQLGFEEVAVCGLRGFRRHGFSQSIEGQKKQRAALQSSVM